MLRCCGSRSHANEPANPALASIGSWQRRLVRGFFEPRLAREAPRVPLFFVVPAPANVRRHFLSWDGPLLPQAVAFLVGDWTSGQGPLDLSRVLVVVPTRQSGRRLREALAAHAAQHGTAVFPPRVLMPELLLTPPADERIASPMASLLAWADVFQSLPLEQFRHVFPVDPPARTFAWAIRLGYDFSRLQRALAEGALNLSDVVQRAGEDFPEAQRWEEIARIESLFHARLAEAGLRDQQDARREHREAPELIADIERVVVIAVPDPVPTSLMVMAAYARKVPTDVLVFAPTSEAAGFDDWGRPDDRAWSQRILQIPAFCEMVHLCAHPAAQSDKIAAVAGAYAEPEGALAIGVADAEVLPLLENALEHAGRVAFNPEGRRRQGDRLYQLLTALATLAREETFGVIESLARCPDFLDALAARVGGNFSHAGFLRDLDALHARFLPPSLAEARRHAPQNEGLAFVAELRAELTRGTFPENAVAVLALLFRDRRFDLQHPADAQSAEAAAVWTDLLRQTAAAREYFTGLTSADWWDLTLRLYGESVHYDDKPSNALELQGWLELLWEDAPHLMVAGLNDGRVPDAIVGDPFLPETLRQRLGLKTNAARFARDAYVLQAIAASRQTRGKLDVLVGKNSIAGEPLRPSRLLLRCSDAELPERVRFLFGPAEVARQSPAWTRAWKLQLPAVVPPTRIAVTAFRSWLNCPLRFYLSRVLRMEAVDPTKTELDVFDFGTLCHTALEAMGLNATVKDSTDAKLVREFLLNELDVHATKRFGRDLTLPLVVQLESARQRLSRAAEIQAAARAEGWVIEKVEQKFELQVGPLLVTAKIDRIDRQEKTGAVRVLDYKTSDRSVDASQAHFRGLRREEAVPEFARFLYNGRPFVWTDLQLPLYLRAVTQNEALAGGSANVVECGYFNLPKAATETGIRSWDDYSRDLDEAAWRCALGVATEIHAGNFWPPNEAIASERDEFGHLFHHGVEASVAWKGAAQ